MMKLQLTLQDISIQMKRVLNYFASKMALLNILWCPNLLFKYFVSQIMIISQNDTFLYYIVN